MAIIKSQSAASMVKEAVVLDLGDIAQQARRILENAEKKAQIIVEQAQKQNEMRSRQAHESASKKGRDEGYHVGYQEGLEKGKNQAFDEYRDKLRGLSEGWARAAGDWDSQRVEMERDARGAVLDFALTMAGKVVHRTLEVDRTVIEDQVAAALGQVLRPMGVTVKICPEDREVMELAMPGLLERFSTFEHVHLVDDATIDRGGCIVSYGRGVIDARVQKQLDRIVRTLVAPDAEEITVEQASSGTPPVDPVDSDESVDSDDSTPDANADPREPAPQ
ncbi:MAG: hypothetical protein GC164_05460 [Phycisphaera sp.]|nr:hypothetical protein [Phycisphaera sp.]